MGVLSYATTFVSGGTLTAAQMEEFKAEIAAVLNAGVDAANVTNATLTPAKLTNPTARYSILVKPVNLTDALVTTVLATAVPGVGRDQTALATHFQVPVNSTVRGISVYCRASNQAGTARDNSAQLFVGGSGIGSAVVFTAADVINGATISQAVLTTDTLEIRVATDNHANDGVTDPHVWVHLDATHTA